MPICCCLCSAKQPVGSDTSQLSQTQFSSGDVSWVTCKALVVTDSLWKALNEKLRSCIESQHQARRSSVLSWFDLVDLVEHDHTYPA